MGAFQRCKRQNKGKELRRVELGYASIAGDLDAAYRRKNGRSYKGQSVNVVETANPENEINLITDIAVNPVNKDDSEVLNERLETLKKKTPELEELHFDGAYGSEANDRKLEKLGVMPVQTGVRGAKAQVEIDIEKVSENQYKVICPNQRVLSEKSRKRYKAEFDVSICNNCPLQDVCPTQQKKKVRVYYFKEKDYLAKKRKNAIKGLPLERRKLRNNVEATVKEFTCRMPQKKLKVRGLFKTIIFAYSVGISVNFGRIFRHLMNNPDFFAQLFVQKWLNLGEFLGNYLDFVTFYFIEIKRRRLIRFWCTGV